MCMHIEASSLSVNTMYEITGQELSTVAQVLSYESATIYQNRSGGCEHILSGSCYTVFVNSVRDMYRCLILLIFRITDRCNNFDFPV